ncbi:unnamed protein product [Amoebophrya sp. A25]|nr:unnamed protein product [Amoebophrya sp. A25]|eukprot:GSA25T00005557001.1
MVSRELTDEQLRDAYTVYEKGYECAVSSDDALELALQALCLDPKKYLKQVSTECVKVNHEGKEAKVEYPIFVNSLQEVNRLNIDSEIDVKEMFHRLSRGYKLDQGRLRDLCADLGFRDTEVEDMFADYCGDNEFVSEPSFRQLVEDIRNMTPIAAVPPGSPSNSPMKRG